MFHVHGRNIKLYPTSCSKWIRGSFFGINRPGRGSECLTISSAEAENEWRYTSTPLVCIQGNHGCHLSWQTCVYEMQGKGELQSLECLVCCSVCIDLSLMFYWELHSCLLYFLCFLFRCAAPARFSFMTVIQQHYHEEDYLPSS